MSEVASLIHHRVEVLEAQRISAHYAEDWLIVIQFMRNFRDALATLGPAGGESEPSAWPGVEGRLPSVLRVDRLAELTTTEGARCLAGAADAVRLHLAGVSVALLTDEQRGLLMAMASGRPVADLADELGYSRRSMYRHLSKLWETLDASGPIEGMLKAAARGLLN